MWIAIAAWLAFAVVVVGLLFWWCRMAPEDSDDVQD